jgi:lipoyl-dependent peroxiredoxin
MDKLQRPPTSLLDPYTGSDVLPLYSTTVVLTGGRAGHGRASGHAVSDDGDLDLQMRLPKALGGPGGGANPEQLFAAGYATCFHGALNLIAAKRGIVVGPVEIKAGVTFGRDPSDGLFLLTADIEVAIAGVDNDTAASLIQETQAVCPYSKMTRKGIATVVRLAEQSKNKEQH